MNNPKCRLINPCKSELGKVSKKILSNAVSVLRSQTTLNNWKNTESVIEWFENLKNKNDLVFIQFDICELWTGNTFKKRYYGHSHSFREQESEHATTLSAHIWKLKKKKKKFDVKWEVVARAGDFNPVSKKCQLCLKEKYYILFHQGGATLNKRSELFSTCRHRLRRLLCNT